MGWTSHVDIDKFFGTATVPSLPAPVRASIEPLREAYRALGHTILDKTPACADQSVAVRSLRESYHSAVDAIALEGLAAPPTTPTTNGTQTNAQRSQGKPRGASR